MEHIKEVQEAGPDSGNSSRGRDIGKDAGEAKEIESTLGIDHNGRISQRKLFVYGLLGVLLVAVVYWLWGGRLTSDQPHYQTDTVTRGDLTLAVSATGALQAVNTVEVGSEISGLIKSVFVDYNDRVAAGQLLARLDTDRLEAEVAQARAALRASEASLTQAEASLEEQQKKTERAEQLAGQNLISPQELESARAARSRAEATAASARAQIVVNRASLQMAETTLDKASIRSPINGVVLVRNIRPGQAVAASFQTPVLFTLAEDLTRMELEVDVDEADISRIKAGQLASFTVDAYPDTSFPATISKVYYAPQNVAGVVTYQAILSVENNGMLLRPGMTATTDIITDEVHDALLVPNTALRFTPPGIGREKQDKPVVWILKGQEPVAVALRTGMTDNRKTQVLSGGLDPGQEVLTNILQEH